MRMKTQRQAKIMEIISSQNVETQEQLLMLLQAEGLELTLENAVPLFTKPP